MIKNWEINGAIRFNSPTQLNMNAIPNERKYPRIGFPFLSALAKYDIPGTAMILSSAYQ